jgi:hypothetical protein
MRPLKNQWAEELGRPITPWKERPVRYAAVVAILMALAPVMAGSTSPDSKDPDCRGECVGNGNARDGRECFADSEVQNLNAILPVLAANGTSCPEQHPIVGVLLNHASVGDHCNRIDVFYCGTAVSGLAEGVRVDRDPTECFSADQTSKFSDLTRTIQANGTLCPSDHPVMRGVKLQEANGCWRAPAVYCQSRDLLVEGDFEGYKPPSLGAPGWVSDSIRRVPAKSETHQPHSGSQNGACSTTTSLDCGMYQEVKAPASGEFTFTVYANANRAGGVVGVNVNGVTVATSKVIARGFGNYGTPYAMTFSASKGETIRVWMYSPASPGYVVIDDATLTRPF